MKSDSTARNLRALFVLGFVVSLLATVGGGLILVRGYPHPEVVQPLWKFGQYAMLLGLVTLAIYTGIFFQMRRALRNRIEHDATPTT
jgi:hypothetical protein